MQASLNQVVHKGLAKSGGTHRPRSISWYTQASLNQVVHTGLVKSGGTHRPR